MLITFSFWALSSENKKIQIFIDSEVRKKVSNCRYFSQMVKVEIQSLSCYIFREINFLIIRQYKMTNDTHNIAMIVPERKIQVLDLLIDASVPSVE